MSSATRFVAETALRQSGDVFCREVGGEMVILDPRRGTYFGLNDVGTTAWGLIGRGASLRDVCAGLVERYDVTAETAWEDLVKLVEELERHGLVEIVGE